MRLKHRGLAVSNATQANLTRVSDFTSDFLGEDRHELIAKLAYEHWEARGRPLGSPEVDWLAAEEALYKWLVAQGSVPEFEGEGSSMQSVLYE